MKHETCIIIVIIPRILNTTARKRVNIFFVFAKNKIKAGMRILA